MSVAPLTLPWATEARLRDTSAALGEPDWLLAERMDALGRIADTPAEPNQLFTPYLDLRAVDFAAVEPYPATPDDPRQRQGDEDELPAGASALVHMQDRRIVSRILSPEAEAAGLVITTFDQAAREHPALLQGAIEGGASLPADDAFGQVARAFATLALFIHVPDRADLAGPVVVRWRHGRPGFAQIGRTVLSLGRGAHARVYEELVGGPDDDEIVGKHATSLWWGTSEIVMADGATLGFAGEQDFGRATGAFVTRQARLGADAAISWANASVGGRVQRSRIENVLDGRGSSVNQVEVGFGDGRQLFDLTSYTRHIGEDTTSDLLSKGVFTGSSRGYIKGLIEIERSARGTDTFLGEYSMLLERTARSVTIPSLEIDQPDVRRAMHSSSVGPIDETQVFYLMSRGLSREAARKAIVLGFLEPVVARIPLPEAQERLRVLLERKWPEGTEVAAPAAVA